jgi:very-short-patch-repair endonuclease
MPTQPQQRRSKGPKGQRPSSGLGNRVTQIELDVHAMLVDLGVGFRHRAFVGALEVDFLIPRPGRRGLAVEVDGDIYHFDREATKRRDAILERAGWQVVHFWGSEVTGTPQEVRKRLEAELQGVPRSPPRATGKERKSTGGRRKWRTPTKVE